METIGASERGLQIVDAARRNKGWTKTSSLSWWRTANTSQATLRRFWRGIAIERETFINICAAVGIANWQKIADVSPTPMDAALEVDYRQATNEGGNLAKTVAISYSD